MDWSRKDEERHTPHPFFLAGSDWKRLGMMNRRRREELKGLEGAAKFAAAHPSGLNRAGWGGVL